MYCFTVVNVLFLLCAMYCCKVGKDIKLPLKDADIRAAVGKGLGLLPYTFSSQSHRLAIAYAIFGRKWYRYLVGDGTDIW